MLHRFADALFWAAAGFCALAHAAILRSVLTLRPIDNATDPHHAQPRRSLEALWAVLPALALAVLFVFTWRAMHPA